MNDPQTNTPLRIVVVDDDPFVRASLTTILTANADIEVLAKGSHGNEAIALYDEHQPDILLIDIQMPEKKRTRSST